MLHQYVILDRIEQEREWERWKAAEKNQDYRTAVLMAHMHNTSGFAEEAREPADYFPFFASLRTTAESETQEMDTAQTVDYLKRGFGVLVPTAYRQRVGLPD